MTLPDLTGPNTVPCTDRFERVDARTPSETPTLDHEDDLDSSESESAEDELISKLGLLNTEEDSGYEPEIRSFRLLWEVLLRWATYRTIELVRCYQTSSEWECCCAETVPVVEIDEGREDQAFDRNSVEIGASRRAGIMNILNRHVARSISELEALRDSRRGESTNATTGGKSMSRRAVKERLANLVNTFDCLDARANKFDTKLWRGMTTILIAIVTPIEKASDGREANEAFVSHLGHEIVGSVPPSIQSLGLTHDEYVYLISSALQCLSNDDNDES